MVSEKNSVEGEEPASPVKEEKNKTDDAKEEPEEKVEKSPVKAEEKGGGDTKTEEEVLDSPTAKEEAELIGTSALPTEDEFIDPKVKEQQAFIQKSTPRTELEVALFAQRERNEEHIQRLTAEILKLKAFISKRKQTYKRKRKETGAPTRALSAYNIFVKERFKKLSRENEVALKSSDTDARLKRVPPASLVASTGNQWKELSAQEKQYYEEKAKSDRKRYEEEMASYQAPEKLSGSRKRNKTGYNIFFSQHVLRLKQSETGVPSERGSVARLVGDAWKQLSAEEKQYYEREADANNQENPIDHQDGGGDSPSKRGRTPKSEKSRPSAQAQARGDGHGPADSGPHMQQPGPPPPYDYGPPPGSQGAAPPQGSVTQDPYAQSMQGAYGGYYGQHQAYGYGGQGSDPYGYGPPPHYGYGQHSYYPPQEGGPPGV